MFTKKAIGLVVVICAISLLVGINIPTTPRKAYGEYLKQGVKTTTAMISKKNANDALTICYSNFSSEDGFKAIAESDCDKFFLEALPQYSATYEEDGTSPTFAMGGDSITETFNQVQDYKHQRNLDTYPDLSELSHGWLSN